MDAVDTFLVGLTVLATTVMAVSAAIQAARHDFDLFGATVLAIVTAVGGGTLRDLLLGATPVFWIRDITYLATAVPVGMLSFLLAAKLSAGNGRRLRLLMYFDAIGLALFTLVGLRVAQEYGTTPIMSVVLGCITGVAGGMFRDLLCNRTPSVLKEDLYATISLLGGGLYLVLSEFVQQDVGLITAFAVMTFGRSWVVWRKVGT